jgi:AmmeMemoRadiSam system protein A
MTNVWCDVAVDAIRRALTTGSRALPSVAELPARLHDRGASFVTLERDHQLLGCVGALEPHQPLGVDIAEHALAAAFDDPRMPPVVASDFPVMTVKVSVLSTSEPIRVSSIEQLRAAIRRDIDGVTVESRGRRATLLPSVWAKVESVDEFLDALWLKAGMRPHTWNGDLQVFRYTTVEHTDPGPRAPVA